MPFQRHQRGQAVTGGRQGNLSLSGDKESVFAGFDHDGASLPGQHHRAGKDHVGLLADRRRAGIREHPAGILDRPAPLRFAVQLAAVFEYLQSIGRAEPRVTGNHVAGREQNHIAPHQQTRVNGKNPPTAQHTDAGMVQTAIDSKMRRDLI